jgi:spermidine/putrescine transport system substrate-binding protein
VLWNEKYAGKILMFDNSRDAFGIAQLMLGYSLNTTDPEELKACEALLAQQKPVLQQYVMDQIFSTMENAEAWIAPYYAGDCLTMMANNPDLAFYLPVDQGFNLFTDVMCIPTCCQEKEAAELFINFLCDPEIAAANMDWVGYGTPISAAKEFMDPDMAASEVSYPDQSVLVNGTGYDFLPPEVSRYMETLFMRVRNGK